MKKFVALAVGAVFASGALSTEAYTFNFNALGDSGKFTKQSEE